MLEDMDLSKHVKSAIRMVLMRYFAPFCYFVLSKPVLPQRASIFNNFGAFTSRVEMHLFEGPDYRQNFEFGKD